MSSAIFKWPWEATNWDTIRDQMKIKITTPAEMDAAISAVSDGRHVRECAVPHFEYLAERYPNLWSEIIPFMQKIIKDMHLRRDKQTAPELVTERNQATFIVRSLVPAFVAFFIFGGFDSYNPVVGDTDNMFSRVQITHLYATSSQQLCENFMQYLISLTNYINRVRILETKTRKKIPGHIGVCLRGSQKGEPRWHKVESFLTPTLAVVASKQETGSETQIVWCGSHNFAGKAFFVGPKSMTNKDLTLITDDLIALCEFPETLVIKLFLPVICEGEFYEVLGVEKFAMIASDSFQLDFDSDFVDDTPFEGNLLTRKLVYVNAHVNSRVRFASDMHKTYQNIFIAVFGTRSREGDLAVALPPFEETADQILFALAVIQSCALGGISPIIYTNDKYLADQLNKFTDLLVGYRITAGDLSFALMNLTTYDNILHDLIPMICDYPNHHALPKNSNLNK